MPSLRSMKPSGKRRASSMRSCMGPSGTGWMSASVVRWPPGPPGEAAAGGPDLVVGQTASPGDAWPGRDPRPGLGANPQPDRLAVADDLDRRWEPLRRVELVVLDRPVAHGRLHELAQLPLVDAVDDSLLLPLEALGQVEVTVAQRGHQGEGVHGEDRAAQHLDATEGLQRGRGEDADEFHLDRAVFPRPPP